MSDSQNWYFSAETNAKGYTNIKAYQTKWDPVRKRSQSFNRRHVGRLHDDSRVVPSKAFLEQFLFYGANKRLVDEETYRRDFPERPGQDRDIEEVLKDDVLNVDVAWAIETLAEESGLFRSLADIFGQAQARELLHLAQNSFVYSHSLTPSAYEKSEIKPIAIHWNIMFAGVISATCAEI